MAGSEQLMGSCQDRICHRDSADSSTHSMPTGTAVIRKANKATAAGLAASVPALYQADGRRFNVSVRSATELSEDERAQIWGLFEENMYTLYVNSSFGWAPRSKKQEMFNARSRFIIAYQEDTPTLNPPNIVAYTMFRFDREEHQNVVYCYELQVSESARHCGLGKLLTQKLSDIGATWGMEKVMLTVFKANQSAFSFYSSVGFSIDEISPNHPANLEGGVPHDIDYSILSIPIP